MFKFMKSPFKKIAITTGDISGIGLEIAAKALSKMPASIKKNRAVFILFRHESQSHLQPQYFRMLDKKWHRVVVTSLADALTFLGEHRPLSDNTLIDLSLSAHEAEWILKAAESCGRGELTSLVTGPVSKKVTARLPSKPVGHTGIFRNLYPSAKLHMGFVGKSFNVLLATDHVALSAVEPLLRGGEFDSALIAAKKLKTMLKDRRKIAVLGLNPHAGEKGLIGGSEKRLFKNLPSSFVGPLAPDAAFLKKNWNTYSVFLCLYHDQGLIPFKLVHGQDSGVHVTLGLPFVRTSVDHGTAEDIFNKNIANPTSMLEAIQLNLQLTGV